MDINFVWRKEKANKEGIAPIYLDTSVSDGRVRIPTGIRSIKKFSSRVIIILNEIRTKLDDLEYKFKREGKILTKKDVIDAIKQPSGPGDDTGVSNSVTFMDYWDRWITESQTRISDITGKLIAKTTISRYKTVKKILEKFEVEARYEITVEKFGKVFFVKFQQYILGDLKYDINTFSDYIKNIKAFCNWLQEIEPRLPNDFRKFKKSFSYADAEPLKRDELLRLYNAELVGHLEKARLILLFLCSTGMRISDFNTFSADDIEDQMIIHTSKKTNQKFYVPFFDDHYFRPVFLLDQMKSKFGGVLKFRDRNRLNTYIETMAKECGITRIVPTTKTGRKTFVTLKLLDKVAPEIIMKSTGHKTRAAFDRYAGIDTSDILKAYKDKAVNLKVG